MSERFVSYAQNGEDVVLWRALRQVRNGCYVDVGAMDPAVDSVTRAFYDRGWRGLSIEPVPDLARQFAEQRPDDEVLQAAITRGPHRRTVLHAVEDTGLSTTSERLAEGYAAEGRTVVALEVPTTTLADAVASSTVAGREVQFLKVDVEGAEAEVLASVDFTSWRPWIVVVEATLPNSTEVAHDGWEPALLEAGYQFCLFDGLNRFYVADEHAELRPALAYPACVLDDYVRDDHRRAVEEVTQLREDLGQTWTDLVRWRNAAVGSWEKASVENHGRVVAVRREAEKLRAEVGELSAKLARARARARGNEERANELERQIDELQRSASWRVTSPLRRMRRTQVRVAGRR